VVETRLHGEQVNLGRHGEVPFGQQHPGRLIAAP
jgi:hypothetical protein